MSVLLHSPHFEGVSAKELATQIEAKKKCRDKLPTWYQSQHIYYPNKLNIEQTSSEGTAAYKAGIVKGETLADLTGGFGVDSYFFSKRMERVIHCEIDPELSGIAGHNFKVLGRENIHCIAKDGLEYLRESSLLFDWIYVDPSRRNDKKGKVFLLADCLPDLPDNLELLFEKTRHVLVKTSPLLDIKMGIEELGHVKEVHVVALDNEVKELLFVLEKGYTGSIAIRTVNLSKDGKDTFDFEMESERAEKVSYGEPLSFLYEPNAAILKSGGFRSVANRYGLVKLHQHSHLYTAERPIDFPGRRFRIRQVLPYSKKSLKALGASKANITVRNFPVPVAELRKKHKIKDGGERYLFFTKTCTDSLILMDCEKI
ncbi:THUMP-like domain-containing protein [Flagellimonas okinawensis]|nr:class I SAM-dependent methyltransferase [[Muricauda] okinawensis]